MNAEMAAKQLPACTNATAMARDVYIYWFCLMMKLEMGLN
jgi:hypothetical protein